MFNVNPLGDTKTHRMNSNKQYTLLVTLSSRK